MEVKKISREELNNFLVKQSHSQFLQSWEWGELEEKSGNKIFRLGVEKDGKIIGAALLIKKNLGLGRSYFYCPKGPITNFQFSIFTRQASTSNFQTISNELILKHQKVLFFLFKEIEKIAKKEKAVFLRFEPGSNLQIIKPKPSRLGRTNYQLNADSPRADRLKIKKTIDIQPSRTIILDLRRPEEEILNNLHQKTRYNIRLAAKKGVKITEVGLEKFDEFWEVMEETVTRDKFRLHTREHYQRMLQLNSEYVKLIAAYYKDKMIAGNIATFFGDTSVYVHGASSNMYRNVMAPYALQWETIKLAREKGCKYYDLYGIDMVKWPGVTRFKQGFGQDEIKFPGTFDFIFDRNWYFVYNIARQIRRFM